TTTAALPMPGHPGEAPAHGGTAVLPPSQSFTGQHDHPTWSGATRPHAPAQAFHPPTEQSQLPAQAFRPPAPHPPAHPPPAPPPAPPPPPQPPQPPPQRPPP